MYVCMRDHTRRILINYYFHIRFGGHSTLYIIAFRPRVEYA